MAVENGGKEQTTFGEIDSSLCWGAVEALETGSCGNLFVVKLEISF